jgi:hypothetical protein
MQAGSVPSYNYQPYQPSSWLDDPNDPMARSMREAAEREELVTDPPMFALSFPLQMGFLHVSNDDNDLSADLGVGFHFRPFFNLSIDEVATLGILSDMDSPASDNIFNFRNNFGVTITNTISEESKTNVGIKFAFTYANLLSGPENIARNLFGVTAGFEFGNFNPRAFLTYSYLSDLNGVTLHQIVLGMQVFVGL